MSISPTEGPPSPAPVKPSASTPSQEQASILQNPFAKMFENVGFFPTAQEIAEMMNNLIKQTLTEIKRSDESWKRAMQKFKEDVIEGQ